MTSPRFPTVPPAVVPTNREESVRTDAQVRASRTRQAVFERGAALTLVIGMLESLERLQQLRSGLRWLVQDDDVVAFKRWLERLEDDVNRAESSDARNGY